MKALSAILVYLAGFIIVPVLSIVTPRNSFKWKWLDDVYGNPIDGVDGDLAYRNEVPNPFMRRFRWSQLRNPINAYLRKLGPNGTVESISHKKHTTTATIDGAEYKFTQYPLVFGLYLWWGYKLLDDYRINSRLEIGHHFENQMILWPLKNKAVEIMHKAEDTPQDKGNGC